MQHIRILQMVSKLTFCDTPNLIMGLVNQYKINPNKYKCLSFIDNAIVIRTNLEQLYTSLIDLERWGLIHRFTYKPFSKKMSYYCCSNLGYNFLRKELGEEKFFDSYLALTAPEEIMKYLATISCLFSFDNIFDFSTSVDFEIGNKRKQKLFVEALRKKDDVEQYILLEPIFSSYNDEKFDKTDMLKFRKRRIEIIRKYMVEKSINNSVAIVLVCDDLNGVKEAFKVLKDNFVNNLDKFYITCDFLQGDSVNDKLLKVLSFKDNGKGGTTPELTLGDL